MKKRGGLLIFLIGFFLYVGPKQSFASTSFPKPFPLTVLQKSSPEFSPYGINVTNRSNWPSFEQRDKNYRLLSEAGIKWVRLGTYLSWAELEPQRQVFNWNNLDREVQLTGNYGLEILGIIKPPCPPGLTGSNWCDGSRPSWWNGSDQDFRNFVQQLINRYSTPVSGKRKIKYWHPFNEWNDQQGMFSPEYFIHYMKIIREVVKQNSSDLKLSAPFAGWQLINEAYDYPQNNHKIDTAFKPPNSAGQYHDFLSFQKYASYGEMNNRNISFIQACKAMAKIQFEHSEYNIANKPVWVTEGGYGCNLTPGTSCTPEGEQLQADDLQRRYWIALHPAQYGIDNRLKIDKIFWFPDISQNTGWTTYEWGTAGLFNWENNYEPRPAYFAYKEMALWYRPPSAVQLQSPANNSTTNNTKPLLEWQGATDSGSEGFRTYVIQIDNDPLFRTPIILENSNPWGFGYSTSPQYQVRIDIPNGIYFWRVKVEDEKGNFSSWSEIRKMTIGEITVSLSPGWNQIAWPDIANYTAKTALEDINSDCGAETGLVIAKKEQDFWEEYVAGFGGEDFGLEGGMSYHVKVGKNCNWSP